MSAWRRTAAGWMVIAGLAACAGAPPVPPAPNEAGDESAAVAALPAEPEPAPAPEPAENVVPPPMPVPDTESFLNRNGVEIAGILGEPGFVRKDPPAELWQYRTGECTLDLYFYDEGGGDYALGWLDFRGVEPSHAARDECLREILRRKAGQKTGQKTGQETGEETG